MKDKKAILYCDGASKGNPGHSGIGIVLTINDKKITLSEYIGLATNNMAEYTALIKGLKLAKKNGVTSIEIFTDSELMVKQISGLYKVKSLKLESLHSNVIGLLKDFKSYSVKHIPRELNKEADCLANAGVNKGIKL